MEHEFAWVYLLAFFLIPLASMVPRMIRKKMKNKKKITTHKTTIQEERKFQNNDGNNNSVNSPNEYDQLKSQPENILVLGELVRGAITFEKIQKNTGLGNKELDKILEYLEGKGLLTVHQKKGLFGIKIELHPTDKGVKKYYS